jgi:transcription elongation factor Elf1
MTLKVPESMQECIYFSNRSLDSGEVTAWVYRKECPKCHKADMGKPVVKGKVKIRAKEYTCPECGFTEEKDEHEGSLELQAKYTCPHCEKEGEGTTVYKRKRFKGTDAYIITCEHCNETIPITKKLKAIKKKK